ncbi:hypothetical protein AGMMS49546_22980 [Spirochaetia bacterium]|nr:hypothetical protein AGMMS49546_22980 [Spirochaetia bacterium]
MISGYPIKLDKKQIANTAKQYKIDLTFSPPTHWGKYIIDINGTQNIKNKFRRCRFANTCIALEDGKLFTCARIPNIKYFNRYFNENLKVTESDYIDIYKARDMHEIFSFLSSPPPFCRYCPGEVSSEWGISKKEITEWT